MARLLVMAAAVSACGTPALRPSGVPLGEIRVVAGPEPGAEEGAAGKGKSAAVGALAGGLGIGLMAALPCLPLGPFAAACLAAAVPAGLTVGAVTGGVTGGVMADDEETLLVKRKLLADHLEALRPSATLAAALRSDLGAAPDTAGDAAQWRAEVEVAYLVAESGALDKPFKLALGTTLTLKATAAASPAASRRYAMRSERAETLGGWQADEGRPLRAAMRAMLDEAGTRMAADLRR